MPKISIKQYAFLLGVFLILWFLTYNFGADFSQSQDRKKFIFRPIEYYQETWFWVGLLISTAFIGYFLYKIKQDDANEN